MCEVAVHTRTFLGVGKFLAYYPLSDPRWCELVLVI